MKKALERQGAFRFVSQMFTIQILLLMASGVFAAAELTPGDPIAPAIEIAKALGDKNHSKWQISTFNAADIASGGLGNQAVWAGESAAQEPGWVSAPGYGNNWDTWIECRLTVSNPGVSQAVSLDFFFNHDTEPGYDFFSVEYENSSGWQPIFQIDGSNKDAFGNFIAPGVHYPVDVNPGAILYNPSDYVGVGNNEIAVRFRVTSDGGFSDEDGSWDTMGAVQIDDVTITYSDGVVFTDFESGTVDSTCWFVGESVPPPVLGCAPDLPLHNSTVGFGTRGYWFESPVTFDVASLRAPAELGVLPQSVEIVLIHAADADFQWPAKSSDYTTLEYFQQVTGGQEIVLTTPLHINKGDRIGILGGTTSNGTSTNSSYSASMPGPYASSIAGFPVSFFRLASDQSVSAGQVSQIFYTPYGELGRFEFVVLDCEPSVLCDCTPRWALRDRLDPTSRVGAAMVYDTIRERTVMFGGRDRNGTYLNDTWEYDGTTWVQIPTTSQPSPRYLAGVAYDVARGVTVLYGGWDSNYLGDTWEWNGTTWSSISTTQPGTHHSMGMTYDPLRQVVVRYGGSAPGGRDIATLEYDGSDWTLVDINSPPGFRSGHAMVYDPSLAKILLYGGQAPGGTYLGDTWTYDGTWTQLAVSGPGPLQRHALAADLSCGGVYLYGGIPSGAEVRDELWKFASGAWTMTPNFIPAMGLAPGDRWLHAMVYEANSGGLLMVGGTTSPTTSTRSIAGTFRYACGQDMSYLPWYYGLTQHFVGNGFGFGFPDSSGVDHLTVANIGSSGLDGVSVSYGEARSFGFNFNPSLPGSDSDIPTAAFDFELLSNTSNDVEDEQWVTLRGDPESGGTGIGADFSAIGASGYVAELWHAGALVASQGGFLNGESAFVLPVDIASMNCSVDSSGVVSCGADIPDPSQSVPIQLAGVPVNASSLRLVAENATVPVTHFTNTMLRGRNYGTIYLSGEAIGTFGALVASGIGELPSLRGEDGGAALRMTFGAANGVADEGLYSSWRPEGGCDGAVSFDWAPLAGGNPPASGSILRFEAEGEMGNPSVVSLGNMEITVTNAAPGAIEMNFDPDYAAVGSTSQRIQVLLGGVVVAEIPGNTAPFSLLAATMPDGCGKEILQLDGYRTACFRTHWSAPLQIDLTPAGPAAPVSIMADAIAVLAENPSAHVSRLKSFSILADGLDEIVFASSAGSVSGVLPGPADSQLIVHRPYPNPFNPRVVVRFETARRGRIDVSIYDIAGRRVRQLLSGESTAAGTHELVWTGIDSHGSNVASGVYFVRISDGESTQTLKATLVR